MSRPEDIGRRRPMTADGPLYGVPEPTVRLLCKWCAEWTIAGHEPDRLLWSLWERGWTQVRTPQQVQTMHAAHLRLLGVPWDQIAATVGYPSRDASMMAVRRLFAEGGRPRIPSWMRGD